MPMKCSLSFQADWPGAPWIVGLLFPTVKDLYLVVRVGGQGKHLFFLR